MSDLFKQLKVIQETAANCIKCDLHKNRIKSVFSRGNPLAPLVFLGEGGGVDENNSGIPFVGKSGQLLNRFLIELGVDVENDIYVSNIVKCSPPNNRKPTDEEINSCINYLEEQLALIEPKVIVALGNTAIHNVINTSYGITKIRGTFFKRGKALVMPAFHPSFVLRNGSDNSEVAKLFRQDLQMVLQKVAELTAETPIESSIKTI